MNSAIERDPFGLLSFWELSAIFLLAKMDCQTCAAPY
ncbi:MAG: hypothetical protein RLZZ490_1066 [Cyanobacteriota bacterium]